MISGRFFIGLIEPVHCALIAIDNRSTDPTDYNSRLCAVLLLFILHTAYCCLYSVRLMDLFGCVNKGLYFFVLAQAVRTSNIHTTFLLCYIIIIIMIGSFTRLWYKLHTILLRVNYVYYSIMCLFYDWMAAAGRGWLLLLLLVVWWS